MSLTNEEMADWLARAREFIEQRGWIQGRLSTRFGVCAVGALTFTRNRKRASEDDFRDITSFLIQKNEDTEARVIRWNDHPGRTKQEVLDLFAKKEKILRAGFDPDAP